LCVYRKRIFLFLHFRPTKKPKNPKSQKSKPIIIINNIVIVLDLPSSLGRPPSVRDDDDDEDDEEDIRRREIEHRGESAGR